jgi:hypothetical protein
LAIAAVICGIAAAALTFALSRPTASAGGAAVPVVEATAALRRGEAITPEAASAGLVVREVPGKWAPIDALADVEDAVGARPVVDLAPGMTVTRSLVPTGGPRGEGFRLRAGERAVTVDVTVSPRSHQLVQSDRVDLLASGLGGDDRTIVQVAGAEVLAVEDGAAPPRVNATLRLAASQASGVVRADVFARELRAVLLP